MSHPRAPLTPPWAACASASPLFLGKKLFLIFNLNLPWHNLRQFALILTLLPWRRGWPTPHQNLLSGRHLSLHSSWVCVISEASGSEAVFCKAVELFYEISRSPVWGDQACKVRSHSEQNKTAMLKAVSEVSHNRQATGQPALSLRALPVWDAADTL